jgi:hypothetical protein
MPKPAGLEPSLKPLSKEHFGEDEARHLLWRAGFGGSPEQVRTLAAWGLEKAVDAVLNYGQYEFEPVKEDLFDKDIKRPYSDDEKRMASLARRSQDEDALAKARLSQQERERLDREQMQKVQRWWLKRLIETPRPLEEKMTLFWHGHFATNFRTIEDSYHMFLQNQLLRKHAVGNFGDLLRGIIRDPAMIAYLNNNQNNKRKPNENLAREIMELFGLGIGNYTEQDIKEGARALTGYTFEDDTFDLSEKNHDTGIKKILGRSGPMDGDDFVSAILAKPECARFIAAKLYGYLVADVPPAERGGDKNLSAPQRAVVLQMGSALQGGNYEIKPVLKRLLMSQHFYDPRVRLQQIKSPAQLVVGAIRTLNLPARDLGILNDAMDLMGQRLFFPPSVKGWDGGRSWINTSTLFIRQNILAYLLTGKKPRGGGGGGGDAKNDDGKYNALALLSEKGIGGQGDKTRPDEAVDLVLRATLGNSPESVRPSLREYLKQSGDKVTNETVIGMLLLATAAPEYQLC